MCEALPPTLEKNTMNLAGYMSICRYIVFWRVTSGRASNEGKPSKHSKTNKPSKQRKSCKQSIARYASVDNHIFLFVFLASRKQVLLQACVVHIVRMHSYQGIEYHSCVVIWIQGHARVSLCIYIYAYVYVYIHIYM